MKPTAILLLLIGLTRSLIGADPSHQTPADAELAQYFRGQTDTLEKECLSSVSSLDSWKARRDTYREQLQEMLGLMPMPEKTDLNARVTRRVEHEDFIVENVHFQTMPGLYITANLYLPRNTPKPVPAILCVTGHGPVITNGVSYGNKVSYQHHGEWFARNGYASLVLDTIQLGELLGVHHGTYRYGMWWWNSRGYTPAGVEAWNGIRALDYLSTRPEIDAKRFGVTGRSGGGAYSWWIAALDDRIKAAAPVAGITDLHNHVIDGTVEGHCDCMFMVNTYRWDYPQVAALVAPRPLLLVNTDNDTIFPLDGVQRLYWKLRNVYGLYGSNANLGLVIGPGPHKDTQDLQVPVFRWFNRFLKGEDPIISMAAVPLLKAEELKVFKEPPALFRTTNIHDTFVPMAAEPSAPKSASEWNEQRGKWLRELEKKTFAGWPETNVALNVHEAFSASRKGLHLEAWDFQSQEHAPLRLYVLQLTGWGNSSQVEFSLLGTNSVEKGQMPWQGLSFARWLSVLETDFAEELKQEQAAIKPQGNPEPNSNQLIAWKNLLQSNNLAVAFLAPRGIGLSAWSGDERKQVQIRRRFMLLGQTLEGMRVWDVRRGIQALRSISRYKRIPLSISGADELASDALLASLFEPALLHLELYRLPETFQKGADYLNILRILDVPQVAAIASEKSILRIHGSNESTWLYPRKVIANLGWKPEQFRTE
ncbi:MAG: hypothetical protein JWM16_4654 [Verrucomicrobiales bacterium]|nr:hypothetical protein [Verrucomicrobiales bacterium]